MSTSQVSGRPDVVERWVEVGAEDPPPLLVLEPLEGVLDEIGLARGPIEARPIGDGHSNVTYLVQRGADRCVLRRPPRGPLPPSAHDVLREAALISALHGVGTRVPEVLGSYSDTALIGAPFFVMAYLDGLVLQREVPAPLAGPAAGEEIVDAMVDGLVELHAVDIEAAGLGRFRRNKGYLRRQMKRFWSLLELNATRPLPELERVGHWLDANLPPTGAETVVHGDYRIGNVMFAPDAPRLLAILDWEMGTIGDPLADLGYSVAMWSHQGDPPHPIADLTPVTRGAGFPGREAFAERYAEVTGVSLDGLGWYQAFAAWKSAIFLEGSYKRYLAGADTDPYFASLREGVLRLADYAAAEIRAIG
jgi:aminoglycoside phosphotransferase (APT) family kinase protein